MKSVFEFLNKMAKTNGHVSVNDGHASFEDGTSFNLAGAFDSHYGPMIERFAMCHVGENPGGYFAEAARSGDYIPATGEAIYSEVHVNIFQSGTEHCVADVLIGLSSTGEPRVLISADANGDDPAFCIYPTRPVAEAMEQWKK